MAGAGHQFPGGFAGAGAGGVGGGAGGGGGGMRGNFAGGMGVGGQMQNMNNQLAGVMGGGMSNANAMVGMGNQMVPPYGAAMQNQMGTMGMGQQTIPVASAQQSPGLVGGVGGLGGAGGMQSMGGGMSQANMNVQANIQTGGSMSGVAAPAAAPTAPAPTAPPPQQNKEFNTASLCKFGQETVQDIVSRTQDVFQTLKAIQPPNGTSQGANTSNEKKAKMQEQLRTIRLLFKRLRLIYEKCNENCQVPGMEYTHIESLIPLKEEQEHKSIDERKTLEAYKLACEENKELTDQVILKNKQLKEVINNLRTIIWEINVMLTMRRS